MRKRFAAILFLTALILCLAGCRALDYSESELEEAKALGREKMEAWLDEHYPGAELGPCTVMTDLDNYNTLHLTDYMFGTFKHGGPPTGFAINIVTGAVYLNEGMDELQDLMVDRICRELDVSPNAAEWTCGVMAPASEKGSQTEVFHPYFVVGIPSEVEDIRSYAEAADDRLPFEVTVRMTLPEGTDLSRFSLEMFRETGEELGVYFLSVEIDCPDGKLTMDEEKSLEQLNSEWLEREGFRLLAVTGCRKETRDEETHEVSAEERTLDTDSELIFEATDEGYRYGLPGDWGYGFYLYADPGSEAASHRYIRIQDKTGILEKKEVLEIEEGDPMVWKETDLGLALAEGIHGTIPLFTGSGELKSAD